MLCFGVPFNPVHLLYVNIDPLIDIAPYKPFGPENTVCLPQECFSCGKNFLVEVEN